MIIICIYWLNLKGMLLTKNVEEENNLDIFEMIASINETIMKLVNREFFYFQALSNGC